MMAVFTMMVTHPIQDIVNLMLMVFMWFVRMDFPPHAKRLTLEAGKLSMILQKCPLIGGLVSHGVGKLLVG